MDFRLTEDQQLLQETVRGFVSREFRKDTIHELLTRHEYPQDILEKAAKSGLIGIHFPREYHGRDLGLLENVLVCEELCRGDSSLGICLSLADFASDILLLFGTDEQKSRWLPKVARGEVLSCGAFTEPNHGSDIKTVDTLATRDKDQWVINGSKLFISNSGPRAGFYSVLCKTDPECSVSYRGLSLILVEADRAGVSAADVGPKMGVGLCYTAEVVFDNVRVPLSNIIGRENRGFYQLLKFFNESRVEVAAQALGIAQGAIDRAIAFVNRRWQFGKTIAEFQNTRHRLADMAVKIETARLLVYKAALNLNTDKSDPGPFSSMAKMYAAKVAVEVCDDAIQLLGGRGYLLQYELERFYWDAKITEIYEGTKEIQKNTIASEILGR